MLEGMKVIEMSSIAAGPAAATMLAEWGADVIKIEPLEGDRGRYIMAGLGVADMKFDADFDFHNRGKRSLALDLARPEAHDIVAALIAEADVFVTNILSEKQAERKLDWAHLSKINPKLVHASISGYGSAGPESQTRAIDHTAFWARSGMVSLITPKGQDPVPIRRAMGDRTTGVALVAGILAAYIEAQRTGRGKIVEASLMRTAMFVVGADVTMQLTVGRVGSNQPRHANTNPLNSFFPTKDGRWIAANLGGLEGLAGPLGHPELLTDPRFKDAATRRKHGPEVVDALDAIFRERTLAEWTERFKDAPFTWAPVQRLSEVVEDEQAYAAGAFVDVPTKDGGSYRGQAMPVGFLNADGKPDGLPRAQAPELGEHTEEILAGLGYGPDRIADLRARNVVR